MLFDLDGVITPTADVHRQAWRETFEEVLPILADGEQRGYKEDDYVRHIDGRPRYEGVRALLEAHGVTLPEGSPDDSPGTDTIAAVGNLKNERFTEILEREKISPYPGSTSVMDKLRAKGVAMALVSSSANAKRVLAAAGLSDAFEIVVDGEVVRAEELQGKPHPDPFLEAARRLDVDAASSVVVEDALSGVEAGHRGEFGLVIGVAREATPEELKEAGADLVVADLEELL